MIIREMPESERPREKLRMNGAKSLTNAELLAVLLASGTKEKTAMDLAEEILSMSPEGIVYLTECAFEELAGISGMGLAKTSQLLAAVELGSRIATTPRRKRDRVSSPEDIANTVRRAFAEDPVRTMKIFCSFIGCVLSLFYRRNCPSLRNLATACFR